MRTVLLDTYRSQFWLCTQRCTLRSITAHVYREGGEFELWCVLLQSPNAQSGKVLMHRPRVTDSTQGT